MGDVVGHLPHIFHQRRDAVQHGVDGLGQPVQFVLGAAHRNAGFQIAIHDGAAGLGDRVGAAEKAAADQTAGQDRQQQAPPAKTQTSVRRICCRARLAR